MTINMHAPWSRMMFRRVYWYDYSYEFIEACGKGNIEDMIKIIQKHKTKKDTDKEVGLDIHKENEKAFRSACENGHIETVKTLLSLVEEYGYINIHAENEYALTKAHENGHTEMVKFLLELDEDEYGRYNEEIKKKINK